MKMTAEEAFKDNPNWTVISDPVEMKASIRQVVDDAASLHDDEEDLVPLELTPATLYIHITDKTNYQTGVFYKRDVNEVLQQYLGGLFFHSTLQKTSGLPDAGLDVNGEAVFTYKVNALYKGDFEAMCNELREGGFNER